MVISHEYKFIFIKTLKTAGTSIEVFLSDKCAESDVFTPIIPPVAPHRPRNYGDFYNHIPAFELRRKISADIWDSYFKFAVERNPWDKTLSRYHMLNPQGDESMTFDEYLAKGELPLNFPRYMGIECRDIIVDRVLRYENLNEELGHVFAQLGISFDGSLGVRAKGNHRLDRRPYQEIYTQEQKQIVADAFSKEIALHGYTFQ